ncbi:MAG: signal transduction histidine kinase/CheY-like chemotaxis protein [Parvicella sp.]|jgi:signal transduction histidine kinase/CheY-like chemotaxis protein
MLLKVLNILYIEDNIGDALILEEHLKDIVKLNSFVNCTSLQESIKLIESTTFDLIFLDLSLPDTYGLDGLSQLTKQTESQIPIVVLTGNADHSIALETLKEGAQNFLVKGQYDQVSLFKTIQYSIERHKVQLELILKNKEIIIANNRFTKAEKMSELGSWEINLKTMKVELSSGMNLLLRFREGKETLTLKRFAKYIHDPKKMAYLDSLLYRSNDTNSTEIEFIKITGEVITTLCKAEVHYDKNNKPIQIYGVTLNISRLKEAERAKEQYTIDLATKVSERTIELEKTKVKLIQSLLKEKELGELKSRFVSTASHQFRTPLTVIQSNIGLLEMQAQKMNFEESKLIEKITNRVKKEVQRMTSITNEVLILGKISAGVINTNFKKESVISICENIIRQNNQIQEDGRKANIKIQGSEKKVFLDKILFEQSIDNMISNAFKYSKGKKAPSLSIDFSDTDVKIEVKDNGMGIPENDLKNLFTPFFRASNVMDIPGSGLGTSILKEYIELNKGTVKVESSLNKGTVFTVNFKLD